MTAPLLTRIRETPRFLRPTAATVLITFLMLILEPLAVAAQNNHPPASAKPSDDDDRRFSSTVENIEQHLQRAHDKHSRRQDSSRERSELKRLHQTLQQLDTDERHSFDKIERHLREHHLPAEILERHREMVEHYDAEQKALAQELDAIDAAGSDVERSDHVQTALQRLKTKKSKKSQQPFDPKNLPFQVPDGKIRAPKETPEELKKLIQAQAPVQVAALELSAGMLAQATTQTITAPQAADLAPTEDVQITDDIKALAQSLNNDPVAIYNWVRNNIEYIPTYGSIQGSQLTLANQKGNAFDTASLLIALYRAAGIPARYVYGTVQIPIEQVMNWIGGVTDPMAALELMGQGGIPNIALAQNGVIKYAKIEHVWVEAYVDFIPSRGAKHIAGDTWVPLDASFKQYEYIPGVDIRQVNPFDPSLLVDVFLQSGTIDNSLAAISNVDMNAIESNLAQIETDMKTWWSELEIGEKDSMRHRNFPNDFPPILAAGLPYQLIAVGNRFAEVPATLRAKFLFQLFASATDRALDNPLSNYEISLPKLGTQRLSFGYALESDNDYQVVKSFMPTVQQGEPLPLDQLPSQLPAYLIRLVPVILLDGKVVARVQSSFQMGADIYSHAAITRVTGGMYEANNSHIVGEFLAIGIDSQGVAPTQGIRRDDKNKVLGIAHEAAIAFFASIDGQLELLKSLGRAVTFRQPSFGFFGTQLTPKYRFGVPYQVLISGAQFDVDVATQSLVDVQGDKQNKINMTQFIGLLLSSFENQIPEFYFASENSTVRGVSSVAIIGEAMRAGQRIFMLDGTNMSSVLPLLQLAPDVLSDISNAINNGLSVITHERNITIDGWTGAGYVIADPKTGGGAYRISGGANGGNIQSPQGSALELSGLTDAQINEHLDILIAGIIPGAKVYNFSVIPKADQPQSIMVKVIRKISTAEIMEDLRVKIPAANDPIWDPVKDPFNPKNLGKIGLWEIALQILFIETIVDKIERASRMDVPLYVQGTGRPARKSQLEVAEHWRDAQQGSFDENSGTWVAGLPSWLHYAGLGFERDDGWYNSAPECNTDARNLYRAEHNGDGGQCDEYPPQAAIEGGVSGDAFLKLIGRGSGVSLRLINGSANMSSGRTIAWFFRFCGISEMFDPFTVKPSTTEQTGGYRYDGTKCY